MKTAETIIIGGGVVGASIAYHLTERGARDVLILERENVLGLGSTGKATGGIRAQFGTEINIRLSLYSLDLLERFNELTGGDCGYDPRGYLFLATDEKQLEFLNQSIRLQRSVGHNDVEIVDPQTIAKLVPGLNCNDILGGSFGARDGFIDPIGILNGFANKAKENGAAVEMCSEVAAIETRNGCVTGVKTNEGIIECENAVLCAGAWAAPLAKTAGIELPVEPLKRQIVWAKCERELPGNLPMVIDLSNGFHFRPAKDSADEILFAYPDKHELPGAKTDFDESFIGKVYEKARHRAPFLCETAVVREKCRAGLYENSPDHHAILGKCDVEGLYLANGFSGHGVMHSPATGRALAEIILDGEAKFLDVSCLSFSRFAAGELLHEAAYI
ncbi:MAG TPA: FAD-dependent oxidoreductase [Pyrinomonadaceae bacterium]|nr:FAD-dependent oxidoreductase [Pyrinomonadaceae bacterium]